MDAVTRLAQDFQALSHDVPGEDKRDSIRRAVETWLEMGDEEFSRQLAERVCNESNVEFTAPVVELIAIRARRRSRLQWCSYLLGGGIHSQGIRLRTEGEPQKVATLLFPVQYNLKAKVANHIDFRDGKPQPESGRSLVHIYIYI